MRLSVFLAVLIASVGGPLDMEKPAEAIRMVPIACPTPASVGLTSGWTLKTPMSVDHHVPLGNGEHDSTPAAPAMLSQEQCLYTVDLKEKTSSGVFQIDLFFDLRTIPAAVSLSSVPVADRPGCGVSPPLGQFPGVWTPSAISYSAVHATVSYGYSATGTWAIIGSGAVDEATKLLATLSDGRRRIAAAMNAIGDTLAVTCRALTPQPITIEALTPMRRALGAGALSAVGGSSGTAITFVSAVPAAVCELGNQAAVSPSAPSRAHAVVILKRAGPCTVTARQSAAPGYAVGTGRLAFVVQ